MFRGEASTDWYRYFKVGEFLWVYSAKGFATLIRRKKSYAVRLNTLLFIFLESNKVLSERWIQIDGSAVKDLTTDPKFQKNATKTKYLRDFKDVVYGQKYGGRYRSYLLANQTGNYTFYTICDDTCQLFLSNGINPRDKHIIIDQTKNVPRFNKTACCK